MGRLPPNPDVNNELLPLKAVKGHGSASPDPKAVALASRGLYLFRLPHVRPRRVQDLFDFLGNETPVGRYGGACVGKMLKTGREKERIGVCLGHRSPSFTLRYRTKCSRSSNETRS